MAPSSSSRIPRHVAIIMDGNGRWAKARGLPRTEGHREGLKTAKAIVKAAEALGIRYLSLYTFSTENWKRAVEEVGFLMGLIKNHLIGELDFYRENRVRIVHSGDMAALPGDVADAIRAVVRDTADYDGITVNLAINYGGRDEILRAVRLIRDSRDDVDETAFGNMLDVPGMPDPDLIVRTGGERRLSNFLLWQSAYAELYFTDELWPDWTAAGLGEALDDYASRDRRFGGAP